MIKFAFVVVSVKDYPRRPISFHQNWFNALAGTVKDYWRDMSGGRVELFVTLYSDLELQMSKEEKDKLSEADLIDAIRAAGNDRGDPFDADEHIIALMDDNFRWGVTATDPIVATFDVDASIVCHELGHFFQHLNKVDGTHADSLPRFHPLEYGDPTCIMGAEGSKYSYPEPSLALAGSPGHDDTGPAMCPPMTVRTGWLDEGNPKAVVDVTHTMPIDVQLDRWVGAPPPDHAGRPSVAIVDDHAPNCDRVYLSLRSPRARWDQGFPRTPDGTPDDTATIVAQELLGNGATLVLNTCAARTGSWMRLGRAPLRIDVRDGSHDSVMIRVTPDPWRNWAPLTTPNGQRVHRVAAVARLDTIDLFVIADDGLIYTLPFRNGMWLSWEPLEGAGFELTAGIAATFTTPDTVDLFVVGTDNRIRRHHLGPNGWEAAWPIIDGPDLDEHSSLAAAPNGRDRVELFATTTDGRVVRTAVVAGVSGEWTDLPAHPPAHAVSANRLADGVIQVHAVVEGADDRRLLSIVSTRDVWEPSWFNHGQVPLDDRAAVASVTPASGNAFLIGAANPMFVRTFKTGSWLGSSTTVDGLTLARDCSLAAVSRDPRSIDVAAVTDGKLYVISSSPDPNFVPADRQTLRTYEAVIIHGGAFVSALPFFPNVVTLWNTEQVPGPAEKFTIHELQDASQTIDGKLVTKTLVAVQAANGKFVTAESGGGSLLIARADKVANWELFKLFTHPQNGDAKVLQALGGHAWRADGDGGALVDCRGVTPLAWEQFTVV